MINVTPVILCGCSGPPPQRLVTVGSDDIQVDKSILVRNEGHCFRASEQLRDAGMERRCASLFNTDRIDHLYQGPNMPCTR